MTSRHENLPDFQEDDQTTPVVAADETEELSENRPVSQWHLLKIIQNAPTGDMTLAELCQHFKLQDSADERLQFALGQLIRAQYLRTMFVSTPTRTGTLYVPWKTQAKIPI